LLLKGVVGEFLWGETPSSCSIVLILMELVFHKTQRMGYWLVFRQVIPGRVDLLDPFSINGFTGSCRVTSEFSWVYPLDPFI
jgi:hypothetical protein